MEDDFDLCAYPGGKLDVFASSMDGSLVRIMYSDNEVNTSVMLKSRNGDSKVCCIRVLKVNSHIHLFYCIRRSENILVHQILHNGIISDPRVVDRVNDKMIYDVCTDEDFNIHIVYVDYASKTRYTRYANSSKSRTSSVIIMESDVRFIRVISYAGEVYAAFTISENSGASVYACNVAQVKTLCVVKRVSLRTKIYLVPDDDGFIIKWAENSMCFGVRCSREMNVSGVSIFGKSGDAVRVRCEEGTVHTDAALCFPSGGVADLEKIYTKEEKQNIPVPKGYEVEKMSRMYKEKLEETKRNDDLLHGFSRMEAMLEKLLDSTEKLSDICTKIQSGISTDREELK